MKKEIMCLDCGCYFTLSASQIKGYKRHKYHMPTHCPACRNIRWKEKRQTMYQANKYIGGNHHE